MFLQVASDMLDTLVDESLESILSRLSINEVAHMAASSRRLRAAVESNSLWDQLCRALWAGKQILRKFEVMRAGGNAREAARHSLADSHRTRITKAELLSIVWSFRFKAAAGESWQEHDPWWLGEAATRIRFRADGVARFERGPLFGNSGRRPRLRWHFINFSQHQQQALNNCQRTLDDLDRFSEFDERGIQAEVQGRPVPSYAVRRHKQTWGWVMESCWVVWSSWPMPLRESSEAWELDDDRLPVTFDAQEQEALAFNTGLPNPNAGGHRESWVEEMDQDYEVMRAGADIEEADEDSDTDSEEEQHDHGGMAVINIEGHYVQLPRALVASMPAPMLIELLRRRLGLPTSVQPQVVRQEDAFD